MRILESQPKRYDRGICLLSLGRSETVRARLLADNVAPGSRVLDLGCGTGTTAVLAAGAGAEVVGIDISRAMLAVAREKVEAADLGDRIELVEAGVSGMERLPDAGFDAVVSVLVFSELSPAEQDYALAQAFRVLKPGGRLAVADETRPRTPGKRLLHKGIRIPLLLVTFALTQTSTRPVRGLPERVRRAGFRILAEERTSLDSFLYLAAVREGGEGAA